MKKTMPSSALLIPDSAAKTYSGILFDVYQWQQKMFDDTTKTFEMLKRPDTVQVIAIKNDKVVMVVDEQPNRKAQTHVPGGRVDTKDKSWLTAAQRELLEETGLVFRNWRLISVEQPQPKIEWFTPWYLATELVSEGKQNLDADGEKIVVVEWDFDKLRDLVLSSIEPTLNYVIPLMNKCITPKDLMALPEFTGKEVDR